MIDLHTHSTESDGSDSPEKIVELAAGAGLTALALCDHDTLDGYDAAIEPARRVGLDLICGIELSTRFRRRSAHLLGYFFTALPGPDFRSRLNRLAATRHDRNLRMAARLRELGLDVSIEEVECRGRRLAGRPHFARLLVEKGYVSSYREAFRQYLDESAPAYVERTDPTLAEAAGWIAEAGGLASLAHPVRLLRGRASEFEAALAEMRSQGLGAIEVFHHDHNRDDIALFHALAGRLGLAVSGGSDYHGSNKPGVRLGHADLGRISIPGEILAALRGK